MAVTQYFERTNLSILVVIWRVTTFEVTLMKLEWDEAKNRINIRKHGFDFGVAEEMFHGSFGPIPMKTMMKSDGLGSERFRAALPL